MDVAFYAPLKPPDHAVPSGDRRMARLMLAALERAGWRATLVSRFRSYDGAGDPVRQQRIERLGWRIAARLLDRWSRPGSTRPRAWLTYHLYHKAPDWLGPAVCRRLSIPYFVAEASYAPKRAGGSWDRGHRATAEALRQAARVFCLNGDDVPCIRPLVSAPDRITMLPPFLDTAPYRQAAEQRPPSRRALARRLALVPETPWLLAVGMMRAGDKLASYEALARSLGTLADRPWQLIVVGDGPARPEVEAALAPLGGERVRFAGSIEGEALPAFYAAADLMVWPAVREAYGMALLEAQATGLPVVAGRTGGVPGVVVHGETGLLATPGDDFAFAQAVSDLLDEQQLRARFRTAALTATVARADIAVAAERLKHGMEACP